MISMYFMTLTFLQSKKGFPPYHSFFSFKSSTEDMFTNFREGGRGKERNIDVRNIDQLPVVCAQTRD